MSFFLIPPINNITTVIIKYIITAPVSGSIKVKIEGINTSNTPVILLTKDNSFEYTDSLDNLGFNDYILKPVKKKDFLEKIDKYVKKDN